jgi:hypothetical protein
MRESAAKTNNGIRMHHPQCAAAEAATKISYNLSNALSTAHAPTQAASFLCSGCLSVFAERAEAAQKAGTLN